MLILPNRLGQNLFVSNGNKKFDFSRGKGKFLFFQRKYFMDGDEDGQDNDDHDDDSWVNTNTFDFI